MRIITSPWRGPFQKLVGEARTELLVVAPYYSTEPVLDLLKRSKGRTKLFLLKLNEQSVRSGVQSVAALEAICQDKDSQVKVVKNLHAKFIVADRKRAIVTSANLTAGGLDKNVEVGTQFDDADAVKALTRHFDQLWTKAAWLSDEKIAEYAALPVNQAQGLGGKSEGPRVTPGKLSQHPPKAGAPTAGWILVHSQEEYPNDDWETPEQQLEEDEDAANVDYVEWSWTSPKMNSKPDPRRVLLAWKGSVFADAVATVNSGPKAEENYGTPYYFVLTDFRWARPKVSFQQLPLGTRREDHRGLIRLDEKILAAYDKRQE